MSRQMSRVVVGTFAGLLLIAGALGGLKSQEPATAHADGPTRSAPTTAPTAAAGPPAASQASPRAATATGPVADASRLGQAVSVVAERVSPIVVSIQVEVRQQRQAMPFGMPFGMPQQEQPDVGRGSGSGVVLSADGNILTNNHVVENASRITVHLQDGRQFRGEVVGRDPATDLAVIKINATNLPFATFADSTRARVGEWVVAIGSPFGLDYTVTAGVVSALGRGGLGVNEIEDYIQTDASINPGNSGGPLVNLQGEVLGINTMIVGRGTGIGFSVPSDIARNVATQLIATRSVRRAWIGVGFQELTPELAAHFGTGPRTGALVNNVVNNGPASKAGIRVGDIVVTIAGEHVRQGRDLLRYVLRQPVGAKIQVGLLREQRPVIVEVTASERPGAENARQEQTSFNARGNDPAQGWGIQLMPMTRELKQRLGYSGDSGVVVTNVTNGSPADRAGLQDGDIIVAADRASVTGAAELAQALSDGAALLQVQRRDGTFFVALQRD